MILEKLRRQTAVGLLFVVAQTAGVAQAEPVRRAFTTADLFALEVATDPQISPDGARVAYVRRSNDILTDRQHEAIWMVDTRTGEQSPIVAAAGNAGQPRWSPDGKRLAYVAADDSGHPQIFVRWMNTGVVARVTGVASAPGSLAWSPDGNTIAFVATVAADAPPPVALPPKPEGANWAEPFQIITALTYRTDGAGYLKSGFDHIFLVPASGGSTRQASFGDFNDRGPISWTRDGHAILFSANRSADWEHDSVESEIFALDIASGTQAQLTHRVGPDDHPVASPDGRLIAYLGFDDRRLGYHNIRLYVMARDGSSPRVLTASLDRSVADPLWSADGRSLYVHYDEHGSERVIRVGLNGRIDLIATGLAGDEIDRPYSGGSFSLAHDGTVAFTAGTSQTPANIAVARGGHIRALTQLNNNLLVSRAISPAVPLAVTAPDGQTVDAWLMMPHGADPHKKLPMILEIHGGPFAAYGPVFAADDQIYAAAGYAVLYVNPSGSTAYGEAFANRIHHAYPGLDYDDLMAAVDAAIARGKIDPDNLFVTGGSGGGVLTAWIVGKTNRFRAAVSLKPVINWASFVLTNDDTPAISRYWFGDYPWENPSSYWKRSPLSLVGQVNTPTMIMVGTEDYRTPVSESEQFYTALRLRGVPAVLVKVPGANHNSMETRPSHWAAKVATILDWFGRYRR